MSIGLLSSVKAGSTSGTGVTSAAIDTTDARLLVAAIVDLNGTATLTDSAGNTWTALTAQVGTYAARLHYCLAPVTSATHTFSAVGTMPMLFVLAFSAHGAFTFDDENGAFTLVGAVNPRLTGTVTPNRSNALIVSCAGDDYFADLAQSEHTYGFTTDQNQVHVNSQHYGGGIAHKIVTTTDPVQAGWYGNLAVFPNVPVVIAAFSVPSPPVGYDESPDVQAPRLVASVTNTIHIGEEVIRLQLPREDRGAPRVRR